MQQLVNLVIAHCYRRILRARDSCPCFDTSSGCRRTRSVIRRLARPLAGRGFWLNDDRDKGSAALLANKVQTDRFGVRRDLQRLRLAKISARRLFRAQS
jgi:hypothetical protein